MNVFLLLGEMCVEDAVCECLCISLSKQSVIAGRKFKDKHKINRA